MTLEQTSLDTVLRALTEHLEKPLENYRRSVGETMSRGGAAPALSIAWQLYDAARHVCAELGLDRPTPPPAEPEPVRVALRIAVTTAAGGAGAHNVVLPLRPGQTCTQRFDLIAPGSGVLVPCTVEARL